MINKLSIQHNPQGATILVILVNTTTNYWFEYMLVFSCMVLSFTGIWIVGSSFVSRLQRDLEERQEVLNVPLPVTLIGRGGLGVQRPAKPNRPGGNPAEPSLHCAPCRGQQHSGAIILFMEGRARGGSGVLAPDPPAK